MSVANIAYIGFEVSDFDAWKKYAEEFLGFMPADSTNADVLRYRIDSKPYRFELTKGNADDLSLVGFQAKDIESFELVKEKLLAKNIEVTDAGAELLQERGVDKLIQFKDPKGLNLELSLGEIADAKTPFKSKHVRSNFLTGDQGVGHVVLASDDIDEVRSFYMDVLGFIHSDNIIQEFAPEFSLQLEFYHCNPRHHSLALVPFPAPKRMHHFMVEVNSIDDVGFALDRAADQEVKLTMTFGRHTNDQMLSFYASTPSGFDIEYGYGGIAIDDSTWEVGEYDAISSWGHKPVL